MLHRATPESPRMFEREWLDVFSRTHPATVPILFVPATVVLFALSVFRAKLSVGPSFGLAVAGFALWTLCEYWLHRLFFHWKPNKPWGERLHFFVHGVHHRWPRDKYRLVMPPAVSVSLFFVFLGVFVVLLGDRFAWAVHSGFVAGYMSYDMTHFYVHHFKPRTRYGKSLRRHHFLHHFKDDSRHFGVSSALWDLVFGTTIGKPEAGRSRAPRYLES
jgi:sterol desaturase/sphingolipid hydroxylase (fatty acid hydroxylase superfamily)